MRDDEEFGHFKGAKVGPGETYYAVVDDTYQPVTEVFSVIRSNRVVGHITVGKDESIPGVVEVSTRAPPHARNPDADRYINNGPLSFGAVTETGEVGTYVGETTGVAPGVGTSNYSLDETNRFEQASQVLERKSSEVAPTGGSGSVSGYVPNWNGNYIGGSSWVGCSPLAAGMAIGYHESGYDRDELVETLADKMNTRDVGNREGLTLPTDIDKGIDSYTGDSDYSGDNNYYNRPDAAKSGVDNNNPPLVSTLGDKESGRGQSIGKNKLEGKLVGHTETIKGYDEENKWIGTDLYLKTNTGWGNSRELKVGGYLDTYMITNITP